MEKNILIIAIIIIFLSGCEEGITPYIPVENNYVSFSILDSRMQHQFVRIQKFYRNPKDKLLPSKYSVSLCEGVENEFKLKDTTLAGENDFKLYYLPNFKLKRNIKYRLKISSDSLPERYAEVLVPIDPSLKFNVASLMMFTEDSNYVYKFSFSANCAKHYTLRCFIRYEVNKDGKTTKYRREVPYKLMMDNFVMDITKPFQSQNFYTVAGYYTGIMSTDEQYKYIVFDKATNTFSINYDYQSFMYIFSMIKGSHNPADIVVKGGDMVFYSFEENYYWQYIQNDIDYFSVRLDQPYLWTNFKQNSGKAYGCFGAITTDTIKFNVKEYYFSPLGYQNGQENNP